MRPRVVHLIPDLVWGSAESQVRLSGEWLSTLTEMHICAGAIPRETRADLEARGVGIHVIPLSRRHGTFEFPRLVNCLWRLRPDVVHLWRLESTWPAAPLALLAGAQRLIADRRRPRDPPGELTEFALRWLIPWLASNSGTPRGDHYRLGSAAEAVDSPEPADVTLRTELGLSPHTALMIYAGGLRRNKRLDDVIWAIDLLNIAGGPIHLVVAGAGKDEPRIRRWVSLTRTESIVHFLGVRQDLGRIWPQCQAAVFAADDDDPPLALLEAMAHGVPILASQIPAHTSLTGSDSDPESTAVLFPVGDRAGIARGMERILADPQATGRRVERARCRAADRGLPNSRRPDLGSGGMDAECAAVRAFREEFRGWYGWDKGS